MKPSWTMVLLMLLAGCGSTNGASGSLGTKPTPSPGAKPAVKKELPWLTVPGGRMKTTLFYGPWQCRREFMNQCQMQCASEGRLLKGCMWLVDLEFDWEGSLFLLPVPVEAGSRYGIHHCCCDYPTRTPAQNAAERRKWDGFRDGFRKSWSTRFGEWPFVAGTAWPGHHIRDLQHGGDPTDPNNIIPAEPGVHDDFGKKYPACYAGQAPWNKVGPDLPYTDN
jgi:hypothetical protein